jgi:hemoglobin
MNLRRIAFFGSIPLLGALVVFACGGKPKPPEVPVVPIVVDAGEEPKDAEPPPPKTLFERLGGKDGVKAVVDTFVKNLQADTRVSKSFAKLKDAKLEHFKQMLVDQICEVSGGDCKYSGKNMKDAHKGMKINESQFNALLEDLKAALEEQKVGENDRNDLFALLAPMKDEIVEVKKK